LLTYEPNARISARAALDHHWFFDVAFDVPLLLPEGHPATASMAAVAEDGVFDGRSLRQWVRYWVDREIQKLEWDDKRVMRRNQGSLEGSER